MAAKRNDNLTLIEASVGVTDECVDCTAPATHEVDGHDPRCAEHHAAYFEHCDCGAWYPKGEERVETRLATRDEPGYDDVVGCPVCIPDTADEPDWDAIRDSQEDR